MVAFSFSVSEAVLKMKGTTSQIIVMAFFICAASLGQK